MSNEEFLKRREAYGSDFSKTVVPLNDMTMRFIGYCVDYGKVTVSYLFLINSGGLAGILALYPHAQQTNHLWLSSAVCPAILFGFGLIAATITAGSAYVNFTHNAKVYQARAADDDNFLKLWHFNGHPELTREYAKKNKETMDKAARWSTWTMWIAVAAASASIVCAVSGGISLIISLLPPPLI